MSKNKEFETPNDFIPVKRSFKKNFILYLVEFLENDNIDQIIIKRKNSTTIQIIEQTKRIRDKTSGKRYRKNLKTFEKKLVEFAEDFTIGLRSRIPTVHNKGIKSFYNLRQYSTNNPEIKEEILIMKLNNLLDKFVEGENKTE